MRSAKLGATVRTIPITCAGMSEKQSVAIVAGGNGTLHGATPGAEALVVFALKAPVRRKLSIRLS